MTPRLRYGSNLAAHWGHLYREFGEKERVTIYRMDAATQTAEAVFAYDFPGKYIVPGTVTQERECCRQPALRGVRVPVRPHLGTAGVAPDAAAASAPFRRSAWRQHRQLAHRRRRDDVLSSAGRRRAVLDR